MFCLGSAGIPLTLPAMLAYGAVAALALVPLVSTAEGSQARAEADLATRDPLLVSRQVGRGRERNRIGLT